MIRTKVYLDFKIPLLKISFSFYLALIKIEANSKPNDQPKESLRNGITLTTLNELIATPINQI